MLAFDSRRELKIAAELDLDRVRGRARWRLVDARGQWFYKRLTAVPTVTRWPCPWSELLCARVLQRLGLPCLEPTLIQVHEGREWILRLPAIDRVMPGAVTTHPGQPLPCDHHRLIAAGIEHLLLFDILVGNGDRSFANLFVTATPLAFMPIDHELALLTPRATRPDGEYFHFVPPGEGPGSACSAHQRARLRRRGSVAQIAEANPIYRDLSQQLGERDAATSAWIAAAGRRITRDWFADELSTLPDALFPEPQADRDYLRTTMAARLAALPELLRGTAAGRACTDAATSP